MASPAIESNIADRPVDRLRIVEGILSLLRQDHIAKRYRSRLWFILPVALNIIGGVIAYMAIRHDDPDKAKNCLLVGILLFAPYAIFWTMFLLAAPFAD